MIRPGHMAVLCAIALLTLGVVMVNSAGMTMQPGEVVSLRTILTSRPALYMGAALIAMAIGALMPVRRLALLGDAGRDVGPGSPGNRVTLAGLGLGAAFLVALLLLVYTPWLGYEKNYSHRWIKPLGPASSFTIQPSEFAKWGLVLLIAWYAARRGRQLGSFTVGLLPALVAIGLVGLVIVGEDLGTGVLVVAAACAVLIAGGARLWHFGAMAPLGILAIVGAVVTSPYRVTRIMTFLDPFADPQGDGYHMIQSMVAVSDGGLAGRGLGHGLQKFGYLPEDTTDFLFAIVCEELGLVGAILVLSLLGGLVWSVWSVAKRERSPMLGLICIGVMGTVSMQALINLLVVTGLGPTKGIALPLMSAGGTGWILTAFCLGLIVAIDRTQEHPEELEDLAPEGDDGARRAVRSVLEAKPVRRIHLIPATSVAGAMVDEEEEGGAEYEDEDGAEGETESEDDDTAPTAARRSGDEDDDDDETADTSDDEDDDFLEADEDDEDDDDMWDEHEEDDDEVDWDEEDAAQTTPDARPARATLFEV